MCNTLPQGKLSEMGRSGESAARLRKGPWTIDEDHTLVTFIMNNGVQSWPLVLKMTGLLRCGKSCRLRWLNYLSPNVKRGGFTEKEDNLIIKLHSRLGNRWSKIATNLPGRTDNEIKNHWHTKIKKKMKLLGLDPVTHRKIDPKEHTHDKSKTNLQPSPSKRPEKENVEGIMSLDSEAMEDMSTTPAKGKQCEVATLDDGTAAGNAMAEMSKTHGNREEDKVVTLNDDNAIELLNNYEMINWHLDLKSWINQGITFGTTGSCSNSGFLSLDDSGNFSMGGESSYLQENTIQ